MLKRISLALLLLFMTSSPLRGLSLMEKFQQGQQGDYVATLVHKNYTLLSLHSKTPTTIVFEEISFPVSAVGKAPDWKVLIQDKADQATSWVLYEMDLTTGKMVESYSVLEGSFLDLSSFDSVLSRLMNLELTPVPDSEKRRIGASSSLQSFDTRKIWNPPLVFERVKEKSPSFDIYQATWPEDKTILGGKTVQLYFDAGRSFFPFPIWMQVKDESEASFKVPSVGAGQTMVSRVPEMPHRLPYFYERIERIDGELVVRISIPQYYSGLRLHLVSYVPTPTTPIALDVQPLNKEQDELIEFRIPEAQLSTNTESDKPYHLMLTAESHPSLCVESAKSFRFTKPRQEHK